MTKFLTMVGNDIWNESGFQREYAKLITVNLVDALRYPGERRTSKKEAVDESVYENLSRAASVLALSEESKHRNAAYHVAVSMLEKGSLDKEASSFSILEKLGNFPAIEYGFEEQDRYRGMDLRSAALAIGHKESNQVDIRDRRLTFTNFQMDVWRSLKSGSNVVASAPTSAGKSYVILNYLVEQILVGEVDTACYVVPSRALITQVSSDIREAFIRTDPEYRFRISNIPHREQTVEAKSAAIIYVLTQERLHLLLDNEPELSVDLVLVDEAQSIATGGRGVLLYTALGRLAERSPTIQEVYVCPYAEVEGSFSRIFAPKEYVTVSSEDGVVAQNLIRVDLNAATPKELELVLLSDSGDCWLGRYTTPVGMVSDNHTAVVAGLFGSGASNLVYAGGPARCEEIARLLVQGVEIDGEEDSESDEELEELARFVERAVHPRFLLVDSIRKGVGFHYGRLPSLVRKEIETAFASGKIRYLVTTSTLLYGINLPAKNLFIDKPIKGSDEMLTGPEFWNLVGRAGRLGKEFEGNIFLVNQKSWKADPTKLEKRYPVHSALAMEILESYDDLVEFIEDYRAAAGGNDTRDNTVVKLYLDYMAGTLDKTLATLEQPLSKERQERLKKCLAQAHTRIDLQRDTIQRNNTVPPAAQQRLKDYLRKKLVATGPEEIIPLHPLTEWSLVYRNYLRIFKRIHNNLEGKLKTDRSHLFFAPQAILWMRGAPIPLLIDNAIRYQQKSGKDVNYPSVIRETLKIVEEELRFRYVKNLTCYNNVLVEVLKEYRYEKYLESLPNLTLFMEFGASSESMLSLLELSVSRTTASLVVEKMLNKGMGVKAVLKWLERVDLEMLELPRASIRELQLVLGARQREQQ